LSNPALSVVLPFDHDFGLTPKAPTSAKNQTQPEHAIFGSEPRGGDGPAHVVRNLSRVGPASFCDRPLDMTRDTTSSARLFIVAGHQ